MSTQHAGPKKELGTISEEMTNSALLLRTPFLAAMVFEKGLHAGDILTNVLHSATS